MLYSTVLRLRALREAVIPETQGHQAYAMVLRLLRGSSSTLTAGLHADASAKPITVSSLQGARRPGVGARRLTEGDPCWVRISFLQEEPFCALVDAVLRLPSDATLDMAGCSLALESLDTVPGANPLVACTTYEALLDQARPRQDITLAFLSPTTFRSKGERNVLFPAPSLVFGSLLARWNAFAPPEFRSALVSADGIRLSGYRLSTRMLGFGSYQELGFWGKASFECRPDLSEDQMRALNALAAFAFYSGVGAKTTMGMGQCRQLENARPVVNH